MICGDKTMKKIMKENIQSLNDKYFCNVFLGISMNKEIMRKTKFICLISTINEPTIIILNQVVFENAYLLFDSKNNRYENKKKLSYMRKSALTN